MVTLTRTRRDIGVRWVRDRLPEREDRPAWIRLLAAVAVVAALATAFVVATNANSLRTAVDVIGHRTAPQVAATDDLSFALADMDAQVANLLLAGDDPGLSSIHVSAMQVYQQRRSQADADLQQAASVAGDDRPAQQTIRTMLDQLGEYEADAADIMLLDSQENTQAGRPSPDILAQYEQATALMQTMLLTAGHLGADNTTVLQHAYADAHHDVIVAQVWLVVCALVLLGALIGLQLMLWRTMRRILNPALLAATAVGLALIAGAFTTTADASHQLKLARYDAFDSLSALEQARAVSYNANADKSRYLLTLTTAPQTAQAFETNYFARSRQLVDLPSAPTLTLSRYADALKQALVSRQMGGSLDLTGLLGNEMRNITFPGERAAAERTLDAYQAYQHDDQTLRGNLDLRTAILFDTGTDPGSSDGDFLAYDQALQGVLDINQKGFDTAISDGGSTLSGWSDWLPYTAFVLVGLLVLAGVRPRLAEYR